MLAVRRDSQSELFKGFVTEVIPPCKDLRINSPAKASRLEELPAVLDKPIVNSILSMFPVM
jgi:hypothetical protein